VTSETLKNPELEDDIRNEFKKLSKGDSESVRIWENFTKQSILAMNKQLLRMNIKPDFNI
jgi:arginyl-tRNA synthetase